MTRGPARTSARPGSAAAKALEAAAKPAELVSQTIERALDPLATVLLGRRQGAGSRGQAC
jgi:hypothetical protein